MSLWELRASGSLKAHSLLLAVSMTVKWCRATGAHEMSKNIPLRPCCWTCHVGCQLGNGLSLGEMFPEFVRTEAFSGVSEEKKSDSQSNTNAPDIQHQQHQNIHLKEVIWLCCSGMKINPFFSFSLSRSHRTVQSSATREEALGVQKPPSPLPTHQQIC